jgi:hypothetical protein
MYLKKKRMLLFALRIKKLYQNLEKAWPLACVFATSNQTKTCVFCLNCVLLRAFKRANKYIDGLKWYEGNLSTDDPSTDDPSTDNPSTFNPSKDNPSLDDPSNGAIRRSDGSVNFFSIFFVISSRLIYFRPLFEVKIGVASWVSPACGRTGLRPCYFNTQKEVLVMREVLTVGDERKELFPLVRLG